MLGYCLALLFHVRLTVIVILTDTVYEKGGNSRIYAVKKFILKYITNMFLLKQVSLIIVKN